MAFKLFLCISYEIIFSVAIAIKTKSKQRGKANANKPLRFLKTCLKRQNVSFWLEHISILSFM